MLKRREEINFILQKASLTKLKNFYNQVKNNHEISILQEPVQQTLLQPVYDPISDSEFYIGEILVTTTMVLVDKYKGWAMILDDNDELSLYISVIDACFGADLYKNEIIEIYNMAIENIKKEKKKLNKKVHSTKVNFDLM
jgi:alpha-D-ribose 1-methylphosphonate 5-triphosphate synthase subunit PhnG